MYCYTYVNNISCIVNELILWSEISSEHPVFIKNVARLTSKDLCEEIIEKLDRINKEFSELKERAENLKEKGKYNSYIYMSSIVKIRELIDIFLKNDSYRMDLISQLKEYGKDDMVWQELIEHIGYEQKFMYETFREVKMQLMC